MRRDLAALIAAVGLASASQTVFSIHDDIDAFPQYSIVFSPSSISSSEAADLLEPPKPSNGAEPAAIPLEYTRLLLHSTPHLCSIPRPPEERNLTSEALHKASLALELSRANTHGWELLAPLGKSCLYYTSGWWSYKFCYNDSITQFHAAPPQPGRPQFPPVRDPRTPQFVLGRAKKIAGQDSKTHGKFYDDGSSEKAGGRSELELRGSLEDSEYYEDDEIKGILQDNGDNRYLAQKMKSGTLCDLTMRPREIEIQYHCGAIEVDRVAWIKEVTTCSYLMVVHTPRLCKDVAFQPQTQAETLEILCKPIIGEEEGTTEPSATDSAPQEPAASGEAAAETSENAADILKSLAKESAKDKPLIIGGTVVGGGEYFPASDPPLLQPPPFWNVNVRGNTKKPTMIANSNTKVTAGSDGKGGNAAAKVPPGVPDSAKLAASLNARLESDGVVTIEILAHGLGQNDGYHIMNDEDLRKLGMSTGVVEGLAEKLRAAAGENVWTLALVEGQGVVGREVRGVIDAVGKEDEGRERAWEDVEELLFGQKLEDRSGEWKETVEKGKAEKKTGKEEKGEGKAEGQQKNDGKDEEEGSEELYYKDEL